MSTPTDAPPSEGAEAAPTLAVEEVPTEADEAVVEPDNDAEHGTTGTTGTTGTADADDAGDAEAITRTYGRPSRTIPLVLLAVVGGYIMMLTLGTALQLRLSSCRRRSGSPR